MARQCSAGELVTGVFDCVPGHSLQGRVSAPATVVAVLRGGVAWSRCTAVLLAFAAAELSAPGRLSAQTAGYEHWERDLHYLGVNAALGAVTASAASLLRGEAPWKGLVVGATGGALVFGGKRVAVEPGWGRGLAGRQIALVGSSMVANHVAGRGTFGRLALGFGPVRYYVGAGVEAGEDWRVDLVGVGAILWVWRNGGDFAVRPYDTLSQGAVVIAGGDFLAAPGTIVVMGRDSTYPYYMAHESVHVLQYDQAYLFWGDAVDDAVWRFLGFTVPRRVELGAPALIAAAALARRRPHHELPWEHEAMELAAPHRRRR